MSYILAIITQLGFRVGVLFQITSSAFCYFIKESRNSRNSSQRSPLIPQSLKHSSRHYLLFESKFYDVSIIYISSYSVGIDFLHNISFVCITREITGITRISEIKRLWAVPLQDRELWLDFVVTFILNDLTNLHILDHAFYIKIKSRYVPTWWWTKIDLECKDLMMSIKFF